jgi:hypothetical protein
MPATWPQNAQAGQLTVVVNNCREIPFSPAIALTANIASNNKEPSRHRTRDAVPRANAI